MPEPRLFGSVGALVALIVLAVLALRYFGRRPSAQEIEKRRRAALSEGGKLGDGEIVDVENSSLIYTYHAGGVAYEASQDISGLLEYLPRDVMATLGPASVKYDRRNPANSIVVSENWSGIRV